MGEGAELEVKLSGRKGLNQEERGTGHRSIQGSTMITRDYGMILEYLL